MNVTVDIIKNGYSVLVSQKNIMKANCTCTLIKENENVIIVDTLTAWDKQFLEEELTRRNIKVQDVTYAIATHGHSDHIGNLNLFTNALHIIGQSISHKDEYQLYSFQEDNNYKISGNIEIMATAGHTLSDISVIVKNTPLGTIAIVGDLFEREEDITNPTLWKIAGSESPKLQYQNRNKILHLADYIIPGHGPMFKVTKEFVMIHESQKSS